MTTPSPESNESNEHIQRLVTHWVEAQTGMLDPARAAELQQLDPEWQIHATQWIAEGLLAYLMVEMVEPDMMGIAQQCGEGSEEDEEHTCDHEHCDCDHGECEHDECACGHDHAHQAAEALITSRLAEHVLDVIDYRDELTRLADEDDDAQD